MPIVFVMSKLRPNVKAEEYEKWVREKDYPTTAKFKDIILSYSVHKITGTYDGSPAPYDYVEHLVITDIDKYKSTLSSQCAELMKEWAEFIGKYVFVFTEEVK